MPVPITNIPQLTGRITCIGTTLEMSAEDILKLMSNKYRGNIGDYYISTEDIELKGKDIYTIYRQCKGELPKTKINRGDWILKTPNGWEIVELTKL